METMLVNWEALDALVIDFATSEHLIDEDSSSTPSSSPSSPPLSSSSYTSRLLIRRIRRSLIIGEVDAALDLLLAHVPSVLDDRRLLFRLQKQKFIELLRKGTQEDRDEAINCLRRTLAPCALDAYPEAYEEFKHVLLAFIYDKNDQNSPVASEWSERRRFDIAGLISSVLISHLNAYDPVLSLTLRYLISIHKVFCFRQGISSAISDLTERLLLEEHDPPAMPQESLYEAPPFDEVDIQALAHAVEITRQGAVDSLRFAKGDLFRAFQNELCRMKMNDNVMDELVREYCVYRGIVDSAAASQPEIQRSYGPAVDITESGPRCCSSMNSSCGVVQGSSRALDGEQSDNTRYVSGSPGSYVAVKSTRSPDLEQRHFLETASNLDDCSTSGLQHPVNIKVHPVNIKVQHRIGSQGLIERNKRKRWRGREEKILSASGIFSGNDEEEKRSSLLSGAILEDDKYETMLAIKELACKGMAAEVVDEINSMDQGFFVQNPELLFQLKQVEFLKLVSAGDHSSALRIACSHLGPLAASDPALLKPLKETLLSLLRPKEEAFSKCLPYHALATSVQVAIGRRLGIEEPQLMKILKATLYSHDEWFKLQMSKDQFEGLLKINSLKQVYPSLLADAASLSSDVSSHGSCHASASSVSKLQDDLGSPTLTSSSDVCDESAIIKVMEFLALPRADAIHLLAQYNGNPETVIQQIFS